MVKRLLIDIETAPCEGYFWKPGNKVRITYENITREPWIICGSFKWEGEKEVYSVFQSSPGNDKTAVKKLVQAINEADEIVYHNGDKFDLPWIRTQALIHGIPMRPRYKTQDTLKIARRAFRFNSNRLDYLGKKLGVGAKIKTEFDLWKDAVKGNKKALEKMGKYCEGDVGLLERVWLKLKNHVPAKTHYGVSIGLDKGSCPECGSTHLYVDKYYVTAHGSERVGYYCKDCGKYHSKPYSDVKNSGSGKK